MRLLNKARHDKIPFSELVQNYAMDRFLFRLSRSTHAEIFILKGALLLRAWHSSITRPTMDIDLLGRTSNDVEHLERIVREICFVVVEPDGLEFDPESIKGDRIVEGADYEGVRLRFNAILDNARIRMQIDVGFGDVVFPAIEEVSLPPMLNFSQVRLRCYSRESTVAEKFEAMVKLGELNSRMKDFFDLWFLSNSFDFSRGDLCEAITQFQEMCRHITHETGRTLDQEHLVHIVRQSNESRKLLLELYELNKNVPSPVTTNDLKNLAITFALIAGTAAGIKVAQSFVAEMKHRLQHPPNPDQAEKYRLLWIQNRIQFPHPLLDILTQKYQAKIVSDELNVVYWDELDTAHPFEALAVRLINHPFNGPIQRRLDVLRKLALDYQIQGVINPAHWGCRQSCGARRLFHQLFDELDIPMVDLDVDCVD
ncbi:nucleotidyl transferase AbiEii/AbiGii toxin family protein, partial [candidate division CSSED10-310 bacterium]